VEKGKSLLIDLRADGNGWHSDRLSSKTSRASRGTAEGVSTPLLMAKRDQI